MDDDRLVKIMAERRWPFQIGEWNEVAVEMGRFTPRQLRDRWMNYLRPPLDRSEFTIEERKEALKMSVNHFGKWKSIALRFGNGRSRSPAMIKNMVTHLRAKLQRLGFDLTIENDIDLLPDVLFDWGSPESEELEMILEQFRNEKEKRKIREAALPFKIQSILNNQTLSKS
jgi:hypothetical protein